MEKEFNISEAEAKREELKIKRSGLYQMVKSKTANYSTKIREKVLEDNNYSVFVLGFIVGFYDNEVDFKMGQFGSHGASIVLKFIKPDDFNSYSKNKEFIAKNNLVLGDIYKIAAPGVGVNLLENEDIYNPSEYVSVLLYFTKQFKERGELVQMIKGFYLEYYEDLRIISELEIEMYSKTCEIRRYYDALYTKEIIDGGYVKTGNVIVIHKVKTDFVTFDAYKIEKASRIKVLYHTSGSEIQNKHNFDDPSLSRCILKSSENHNSYRAINTTISKLIEIFAQNKVAGNRVEIYTEDEYNDYLMLVKTEGENILKLKDDEHYIKLSKHYEEIYERR